MRGRQFENVCELDLMFSLEKAHFVRPACTPLFLCPASHRCLCPQILGEMVMNGCVVETNKTNVLKPILLLEKTYKS